MVVVYYDVLRKKFIVLSSYTKSSWRFRLVRSNIIKIRFNRSSLLHVLIIITVICDFLVGGRFHRSVPTQSQAEENTAILLYVTFMKRYFRLWARKARPRETNRNGTSRGRNNFNFSIVSNLQKARRTEAPSAGNEFDRWISILYSKMFWYCADVRNFPTSLAEPINIQNFACNRTHLSSVPILRRNVRLVLIPLHNYHFAITNYKVIEHDNLSRTYPPRASSRLGSSPGTCNTCILTYTLLFHPKSFYWFTPCNSQQRKLRKSTQISARLCFDVCPRRNRMIFNNTHNFLPLHLLGI